MRRRRRYAPPPEARSTGPDDTTPKLPGLVVGPSPVSNGAKEGFLCVDMPGLAKAAALCAHMPEAAHMPGSFTGGRFTYQAAIDAVATGDNAGVEASDTFLRQLEEAMPHAFATGWQNIDGPTGSFPNVPAMLQGHPYHMRQRVRVSKETTPLTVYADLTISAGVSSADLRKRGSAILALVRALASRRPVELYAVSGAGTGSTCMYVLCKIDTAPLDLSRAAHVLTSPAVYRGITFAILQKAHRDGSMANRGWGGSWAYGDTTLYRETSRARLMAITGAEEGLYISAAHLHDPLISTPLEWLRGKLVEYGGAEAA